MNAPTMYPLPWGAFPQKFEAFCGAKVLRTATPRKISLHCPDLYPSALLGDSGYGWPVRSLLARRLLPKLFFRNRASAAVLGSAA
jgi:hypothetical protein